ncbi:hypothetical protein JAAARDRAFT_123350 [Jaapia argillacea MUCL 33604]|uniref:PQ-loop repeat-containing protein 1 n=1 Tax=Jaapia argillacea MUCL 33604 TaxID=933084 RepID=A0A067Q3R4_9AGAM|nr:hypothetical protein JAAARDRAFT_123350 [Jaapia argillacea MUCL 33604]
MVPSWLSTLASVGMAIGPPLVYADQAISIIRKKDATGFSRDVCAILLIANVTRCFFWLGNHFEFALLLQSILMILAQLALLYICILYRPKSSPESLGISIRPLSFWQWPNYSQYIEFLAAYILCMAILFLIFGRSDFFIATVGFVSLGLESTLPIPQLVSNYKQRSLYGFRASTLVGWVGGDSFKLGLLFGLCFQSVELSPSGRSTSSCRTLPCSIILQRIWYGTSIPATSLPIDDDIEQALALDEE